MTPTLALRIGALTLVLLSSSTAHAQEALIDQAKRLVVMVDARFGDFVLSGAGIVLGQRASERDFLIATARHVVVRPGLDPDAIQVRSVDDEELVLEARILGFGEKELDLAFLSVGALPGSSRAMPWQRLGRASGLEFGDGLFAIGQHEGELWQHNAQPDAFKDRDGPFFRFDSMLVSSAASGGGVFDRRWHVVGMVLGSADGGPRGRALSIDAILAHLADQEVELVQGLGVSEQAAPLLEAPSIEDDLEPGVTGLVIGEEALGEIARGQLEPARFELAVPAHGRMVLTAQNLNPKGSREALLGPIEVTDQYGNSMVTIEPRFLDSSTPPASSHAFAVQGGQRYRVAVVPMNGSARISFSLLASFSPVGFENLFEPNDTAREGTTLRVGRRTRNHVGYGYDSADHWILTPDRTGIMSIQVQNLSPGQTEFAQLAAVQVHHVETSVPRPGVEQRFLHPGNPAHSSHPFTVEAGTSYVVRIEPAAPRHATPYELTSALEPYPIQDRGEPNDDPANAYDLTSNAAMDAIIGLGVDVRDCYVVQAKRSGELAIEVQNRNPGQTQFGALAAVRVTDGDGNVLTKVEQRFLSAGAPPASSTLPVEAGRSYYVHVEPLEAAHIVHYTLRTSLQ